MEFRFTEEQEMIRDTADAFLAEASTSEAVRRAMVSEPGYDASLWERICLEMGWSALLVPEAHGGLGLGFVELTAIMEQSGRYLLCSPFMASACISVLALRLCADETLQSEWLPRLAAGETATLVCAAMADRRRSERGVTHRIEGDKVVLNGQCDLVLNGASTDHLLVVSADHHGSLALTILSGELEGVTRARLPSMDQTRALAQIRFDEVSAPASALCAASADRLTQLLDLSTIALAAEQLGGAQQALDISVAYTKERVQFGRTIASYQAIKHKAADIMLQVESARSAVYYAACIADEVLNDGPLAIESGEAASAAKAYCNDAFFFAASHGLQMHGGVGFTEEYDIQLYFKRANATKRYLGDSAWHRERIAALLLDGEALA